MFGNNDKNTTTCPYHDLSEDASSPLFGTTSFSEFNKILAGSCAAFTWLVIILHLFHHATHLSVPREQLKIMRIAILPPLYSIFSFLCICWPAKAVYFLPWLDTFQAASLVSYFLLLCEYVSPHHEGRDLFFSTVELQDKRAKTQKLDGSQWFRHRWIGIFQYPVVVTLAAVATDVTEAVGVFCQFESKPHFAKLWIGLARDFSSAVAFTSIIMVALTLKKEMPHNKPILKLVAIKLVVGLAFIQSILFWILDDTHALKPTDQLTYADLKLGIPALLSCLEMVPICFLLVWSYPVKPYKYQSATATDTERLPKVDFQRSYQGGFLGYRAILGMMSPVETLKGVFFAFQLLIGEGVARYAERQ